MEQLEIEEKENNKEHYFGKLRRSHSHCIIPDIDEEIKEVKGEIKEFIRVKIDTLDNSQTVYKDNEADIQSEISAITSRLPSQKFRLTKKFEILPGYHVENKFQYPDMFALTSYDSEKL